MVEEPGWSCVSSVFLSGKRVIKIKNFVGLPDQAAALRPEILQTEDDLLKIHWTIHSISWNSFGISGVTFRRDDSTERAKHQPPTCDWQLVWFPEVAYTVYGYSDNVMFGSREENALPSRSEHAHVRAGSASPFRIWGCSTPRNVTLSRYNVG